MEPAEREERQPRALWVLVGGLALLGVILAAVIASCTGSVSDSAATATTAAVTNETATMQSDLADVVGIAAASDELTTLEVLLDEAGLTGMLQGEGPFTVFTPTDEAFAAVPADVLAEIEATPDVLGQVLSYHVVPGHFVSTDLATGQLETVSGEALDITVDGGTVTVGGATVTEPDIAAANGVIHMIDQVLIPPSVADALGASPDSSAPAETDLIDTAAGVGFATLTSLLDEAGLTETLQGEGPYTVFAPTDDAFAAVPADVLDALEKNPNALRRVLTYHLVPGALQSGDLATGPLETAEGGAVEVVANGGTVTVGDATVTQPDVVASNGILHGIDTLLLPPDLDLVAVMDDADYAVYFATGSAELNTRANKVVEVAAAAIKELPAGSEVTLIGVADQRGDVAFNEQLSRDRAAAVQAALEALGAEANYVIDAKGAEANQNLAKARRVNIVLPRG